MADRVWVVDSSAAINLRELPPASALETVNRLVQATQDGLIAFPEQVYREVSQVRFADLANAYVGRAWEEIVHPKVVDYEILHEVLNDPIGSLLVPPRPRTSTMPTRMSSHWRCSSTGPATTWRSSATKAGTGETSTATLSRSPSRPVAPRSTSPSPT